MSTGLLIIVFAFIFGVAIVWHFVTLNYVLHKATLDICVAKSKVEFDSATYLKISINSELSAFTDVRVDKVVVGQTYKRVLLSDGREFTLVRDEYLDSDLWDILYRINVLLLQNRSPLGHSILTIDRPRDLQMKTREKLTWDDYD